MAERLHGSSTTWLTCDEVAFVQRLGTHIEASVKTPRLLWLQRYLEGAKLRQDWGKIDKATVIQEAMRLLRAELRREKMEKAA